MSDHWSPASIVAVAVLATIFLIEVAVLVAYWPDRRNTKKEPK
jgi:hypothetical protein